MFNGLERNLTNVTREVVNSDNKIRYLNDQVDERNRKLNELTNKSSLEETRDLLEALERLQRDNQLELDSLKRERYAAN